MTDDATDATKDEDEIVAKLSDYLDDALPASERTEIAAKIAADGAWKRIHDEMVDARNALSGMRKAHAPPSFEQDITSTIHKRSAGRLFAPKRLGDRVPFNALIILAVLGLVAIGYVMYSSSTGSLERDKIEKRGSAAGSADRTSIVPEP